MSCTLQREDELDTRSAQREYRRVPRVAAINQLKDQGYQVRAISPYLLRINERLDYFPVNDKYHDLRTDVRGTVRLTKPKHITADQWWYGQQQQFFIRWFFSCPECLTGGVGHDCKRKETEVTA